MDPDQLEAQLRRKWSIPSGRAARPTTMKGGRSITLRVENKNFKRPPAKHPKAEGG
jgi:hypothetical protein